MAEHLALDIETVPAMDLSKYSKAIQEKVEEKITRQKERKPEYDFQYFASTHGDFGKIICISMGYIQGEKIRLKSLYGEDEQVILEEFNRVAATVEGIFIHYNGISFDIPFILQRMAHHSIRPSNVRLSNLRRYSSEPHFDLMMIYYNWDYYRVLPLGILAELHQLPSPKEDLSGEEVYSAYLNKEWERIVRYCEFDVATTLNLWNKLYRYEPLISVDNYEFSAFGEK